MNNARKPADDETKTFIQSAPIGPRSSVRRRPRWLYALGMLAIVLAVAGGIWWWPRTKPDVSPGPPIDELDAAIAEADQLDPGWRWEELKSRREVIPEGENSATVIAEFTRFSSGRQDIQPNFLNATTMEKPKQLTATQRVELTEWLASRADASKIALTLADYPRGRHVLKEVKNPIATLLPHTDALHRIDRVLTVEAALRAENEEPAKLNEFRAHIHAARSIGDEAMLVSQMVRQRITLSAVQSLERTLSFKTATEEALALAQAEFEVEACHNGLLAAFRGDRATLFMLFERLDTGELTINELNKDLQDFQLKDTWPAQLGPGSAELRGLRAQELRFATQIVEITKKSISEHATLFRQLNLSLPIANPLEAALQMTNKKSIERWFEAYARFVARMRAAQLGIAAERYRLRHGRWPVEIKALDADLATGIQPDPYTGGELRLRRLEDGFIVYSVGPNGRDEGGDLTGGISTSPDIGFRLWDAQRRK